MTVMYLLMKKIRRFVVANELELLCE